MGPVSQSPIAPAFAHLNLRYNPFGELPPAERCAIAVADVERFLLPLARPGFAVQFLGERGRGKTTHLFALRRRIEGAPYVYFAEGAPPPTVPDAPVVVLDELQRLAPRTRRALFRREASFVIGSHEDHADDLGRAGVRVETVRLCGLDPARLGAILARRIEAARRAPGPVPVVSDTGIGRLLERFGDDVRSMEHHLYECFQRQRGIGDVEV